VRIQFYNLFIVLVLTFFTKKFYGQSLHRWTDNIHSVLNTDSMNIRPVSFRLQKDAYIKNLAFFCRQEWKLEKTLRVPLRLRVGSLEQS